MNFREARQLHGCHPQSIGKAPKPRPGADSGGIIRKNPACKMKLLFGPGIKNRVFINSIKKSGSDSYTFSNSVLTKSTSSRMYFSEKSNRIPAAV